MYHFKYVSKKEAAPFKKVLIELINRVQDQVRDYFTFQFYFIGSSGRNMITYDPTTNIGFDFDVNLVVNDDEENYSAQEIRTILRTAITKIGKEYGFNRCEDSTRVITLKEIDRFSSRISWSCDFAIVNDEPDCKQYIHLDKLTGSYFWEYQEQTNENLYVMADHLKKLGVWSEVKDVYLDMKNHNDNPNKHSRSLFAEAVNECYSRHHPRK